MTLAETPFNPVCFISNVSSSGVRPRLRTVGGSGSTALAASSMVFSARFVIFGASGGLSPGAGGKGGGTGPIAGRGAAIGRSTALNISTIPLPREKTPTARGSSRFLTAAAVFSSPSRPAFLAPAASAATTALRSGPITTNAPSRPM